MNMIRMAALLALAAAAPAFAGTLIIQGGGESAPAAAPAASVRPSTSAGSPAGSAPTVAASPTVRTWRVESGDVRLSTTLERWTAEAGYMLIWDAQKQVLLSAKDSFSGTLEEALTRVLSSPAIRRSEYPLEACFYPNSPPVIRVTRLGEQAEECPL